MSFPDDPPLYSDFEFDGIGNDCEDCGREMTPEEDDGFGVCSRCCDLSWCLKDEHEEDNKP